MQPNLDEIIRQAADEAGIPQNVLRALIKQESRGNARAVSPVGAMGLTQLMPATAKELGVSNPFDPSENARGGARYLRRQYDTFGSWPLALAAYNAGAGNVRKHKGIPPFKETQGYVANIMKDLGAEYLDQGLLRPLMGDNLPARKMDGVAMGQGPMLPKSRSTSPAYEEPAPANDTFFQDLLALVDGPEEVQESPFEKFIKTMFGQA